jgi:hypothetical protein
MSTSTQGFTFTPKPLDFAVAKAVFESHLFPRTPPPVAAPQAEHVTVATRACVQCEVAKPLDEFSRDGRGL